MKTGIITRVIIFVLLGSFIFSACASPVATSTPGVDFNATALDDWLGPYAPERLWGNPREAINSDGWSFTYQTALTTPYQTGEDGIASLTDKEMNALVTWAFYTPGENSLTERLYGLNNPQGEYGETILEDRVFKENTPTHSYMRYIYSYPYKADFSQTTIEYAKLDGRSVVAQLTITGLDAATAPLTVVPEILSRTGKKVTRQSDNTYIASFDGGVLALVAETAPQSWQITQNQYPDRAQINASIVNNQVLTDSGSGNKAAWQYTFDLTSGSTQILRFGIGYAGDASLAVQRAKNALASADETLATRKTEADALYRSDVTAHQDVYQAALMDLLWNKMYYLYDGSYQSTFKGKVDIHDVVLAPDKWEFPWPAMWDACFQAKVATLADISLAKHDLNLYLSDRWQTATGHVPNTEWDMIGETPPLFAWAAWQVYQQDGDLSFLESVFPQLEAHYAYLLKAYDRDHDHLFNGGFMGMDNLPRPANPDVEQADMSGWMALFASDMRNISDVLGKTDRTAYYSDQYNLISNAINTQMWDETTGFYYDRNAKGLLLEKSYTGLIPFIAGVSSPEQDTRILASLSDPAEFWSDYGIRSLPASSAIYEPGYSGTGWKNSNWRGPVWLPINYLLVQRVEAVDPTLGDKLRENLIGNVERNWQASGRFYEYYDAESGQGIGADHQTGWTALVANLIYEKYRKYE
jgi:hypothetical protein